MKLRFSYRDLVWLSLLAAGCSSSTPDSQSLDYPLAGKYRFTRTSANQSQISQPGGDASAPMIAPKVVEVAWDDRFILAKRQGLKPRGLFKDDKFEVPDPQKFDYWVLDTSGPQLHGPMSEAEFTAKREELTVPNILALKDAAKQRPK